MPTDIDVQEKEIPELKVISKREIGTYEVTIDKLADELMNNGIKLVSGGTDNHLLLLDLREQDITGKDAEALLQSSGIISNKNTIPFDPQKPFIASGLRLGTPMLTTRGLGTDEMRKIARLIIKVLKAKDQDTVNLVKKEVELLCQTFPIT